MALTRQNTGWEDLTSASSFVPHSDINDSTHHAEDAFATTADAVADLPSSGNWVGRHVWVSSARTYYSWDGSSWVTAGASITMLRSTTALTSGANAYGNASANSGWSASRVRGPMTYNNGIIVPAPGEYEVWWSLLFSGTGTGSTGTAGIAGVAVNAGSTLAGGQVLAGIGPIVNNAALTGSGHGRIECAAGDVLTLWIYGQGGVLAVAPNAQPNRSQWGAKYVGT